MARRVLDEMAEFHRLGVGDEDSYRAGWMAAIRNKSLEFSMKKVIGSERKHSFRAGYLTAFEDEKARIVR